MLPPRSRRRSLQQRNLLHHRNLRRPNLQRRNLLFSAEQEVNLRLARRGPLLPGM